MLSHLISGNLTKDNLYSPDNGTSNVTAHLLMYTQNIFINLTIYNIIGGITLAFLVIYFQLDTWPSAQDYAFKPSLHLGMYGHVLADGINRTDM